MSPLGRSRRWISLPLKVPISCRESGLDPFSPPTPLFARTKKACICRPFKYRGQDLNLRPPGYETRRSRSAEVSLAHLRHLRSPQVMWDQLRWVQNGYKFRASSGNTRCHVRTRFGGRNLAGRKAGGSHRHDIGSGPDSKTSRPGVAVSLSAAMSIKWTRYYDAAGEQPRETLLFALERFDAGAGANEGGLFAVDL